MSTFNREISNFSILGFFIVIHFDDKTLLLPLPREKSINICRLQTSIFYEWRILSILDDKILLVVHSKKKYANIISYIYAYMCNHEITLSQAYKIGQKSFCTQISPTHRPGKKHEQVWRCNYNQIVTKCI